jgi:anti-anti-sigma factor
MHVTEDSRGAWHVVAVAGRADNSTADSLKTLLCQAVEAHAQVAVDCSAIDYISSAGVGALVEGAAAARRAGRRFTLFAPSPRVQQVLKICKLDTIFTIESALPSSQELS